MKKLILILSAVFAALAMQSCSATFHASHRHPVPPRHIARVDVHVGHHPQAGKHARRYRKYPRHARSHRRDYRNYGMRPGAPVPPRHSNPVPPRRPRH